MKKQVSRIVSSAVSLAMAVALCPAVPALADEAAAIDDVKALIEPLSTLDPFDVTDANRSDIQAAQTAFEALSAEDQQTLDSTKCGKQSYGRVLESAVWSLSIIAETDNSTTLPDGTYTQGFTSVSDKGKYVVTSERTWSVPEFTVSGGKVFASIACNETGNYPTMKSNGEVFNSVVVADTAKKNHTIFYNVPLDLNAPTYFAVRSTYASAGAVAYKITATIAEPEQALTDDDVKTERVAATAVSVAVSEIGEVTLDSKAAIEKARSGYEALSVIAKNYVPATTVKELEVAEAQYAALVEIDAAKKQVAEAQDNLKAAQSANNTSAAEIASLKSQLGTAQAQLTQAQKDVVANSAVTLKSAKAAKKKVTVKWAKSKVAEGYVVYRSMKKSKGFKAVKTITKASTVKFVDKKVKKGKKYFYKVRAFKTIDGAKIMSDWSTVLQVKAK